MGNQYIQQINKYCFISYVEEPMSSPDGQRKVINDCLAMSKVKKKNKKPFYIKGYEKIPPRNAHHISWPENFLEISTHPSLDIIFLFNDQTYFSVEEARQIYRQSNLSVHKTVLIIVQESPSTASLSA